MLDLEPLHPENVRVFFLRHGEVALPWRDRFYGQMDVPLSEKGQAQSEAVARRLREIPFAAVVASDLQRAARLGALIGDGRGLDVAYTPTLRERHFGRWQGKSAAEIEAAEPEDWARYTALRWAAPTDGGESLGDLERRALPTIAEVVAGSPGHSVVVAAHAGTARVFLNRALGIAPADAFDYRLDHCSVSIVEYCRVAARGLDEPFVLNVNG